MTKAIQPRLIIRNNSRRSITLLQELTIKPSEEEVDLFKAIPGLSESRVIDALRAPNGELYLKSSRGIIDVVDLALVSFSADEIGPGRLDAVNTGISGQVLALGEDGQFEWVFRGDVGRLEANPPLIKSGDTLSLLKADGQTNGFLSKEDWLIFMGKSKGIRIWQYQDFDTPVEGPLKIRRFENGTGLLFDKSYIIDGSAVIVSGADHEKAPLAEGGVISRIVGGKKVNVVQHEGDTVVLNANPGPNSACRVYFLVILPDGVDLPNGYEQPPVYVRNKRIELVDFVDIDTGGSKSIKGRKTFDDRVAAKQGLDVVGGSSIRGGFSADSVSISGGASNHYTLTSDPLGNASWQPSPAVGPVPPHNNYEGQLWLKTPEYELFLYDGNRKTWVSVDSFKFSAGLNSPSCSNQYLRSDDNIPTSNNGFILPYDAVLVGITASSEAKSSWVAEVHMNHSLVGNAVLPVVNFDRAFSTSLNVNFRAGDKIQLYVKGEGISLPRVEAVFRKRI